MASKRTIELVQATVPALQAHGLALTTHFYTRLFAHEPELRNIFNLGNQAGGRQQQALAQAVLAYAQNIENPAALAPVASRIAHKHASIGIRAKHYPIVGRHLLASIREVLGTAATEEIIAAWAEAYGELADVLIAAEAELYRAAAAAPGGWDGWREFVVERKESESELITSFYLRPADGGALPPFVPGQFVSLVQYIPELGHEQIRQYSLSEAPNTRYFRISVKREGQDPQGAVSNRLHDAVNVGDRVRLSPPYGDFYLDEERTTPVVLVSGGVGLTPMISMLNALAQTTRRAMFVHGARNGRVHALKGHVEQLAAEHAHVEHVVFYDAPDATDVLGRDYHFEGVVDLERVRGRVELADADYYLCGPLPFMLKQRDTLLSWGVPAGRVHYEVFGPDQIVTAPKGLVDSVALAA
ncbi:NO-inducible flavohemoprotein [Aromatoleum toluclasticum]|uniref:NO-inducible flavohemoprotein n=1 Tax=Aromatoleum toluclasticum TaxID=92003 RepID=UPI000360BD9E|nr:NO-inducible flavohemoprotein [Aromatoleum toluclasticum]